MTRHFLWLSVAWWLVGCGAGPISTQTIINATPVGATAWPPQVQAPLPNGGGHALVQLPYITLVAEGTSRTGVLVNYSWQDGAANLPHYEVPPPLFPTNTLTLTLGQPLTLTTDQPQAPVAWLWVAMDAQGNLQQAGVLPAPQNTLVLAQPGDYVVKLLAQWDAQNYVAYLFRVVVE